MFNSLFQKFSSTLGLTSEEIKKAAFIPLFLLLAVIMGDIVWRAVGLPGVDETILLIKNLFVDHGYPIVLLAAFIEAFLLIGLYLPGSVALILASTLSGQGVLNIWLVILLTVTGFLSAAVINYALGRFGWYHLLVKFGLKNAIEKMKIRAETKGFKLIHFTYLNPNLASLSATSFGILRVNFYKFLFHSVIAFMYWNIIWGFTFYFLGDWVEERLNYTYLILLLVLVITGRILYTTLKKKYLKYRM